MQGRDFLAVAARLCRSDFEADRRTSVSRAYFAVFNHIKAALIENRIRIVKTAQGHRQISDFLNNSGIGEDQKIAVKLDGLRTIRDEADYDLHTLTFNQATCTLEYQKAERLVHSFNGVDVDALVAGIRVYMDRTREPR